MCQSIVGRLWNHPGSCQVRKVASLLARPLTNCLNASLRNIQNLCWCFRHHNPIGYILQLLGLSLDSLSLFTNLLGLISNFLGLSSDLLSVSLKLRVIGSRSSGSSNLCCFSGDICSSIGNLRGVARNSRGVTGGSTSCVTYHVIRRLQNAFIRFGRQPSCATKTHEESAAYC